MKRLLTPVVLLAAIALCFSPVFANSINLVANGEFELPDTSPNPLIEVGTANSTLITGWTVTSGNVDLDRFSGSGDPYSGAQWLDLSGRTAGTIQQIITTTPGQSYELTFHYANNIGATSARMANVFVLGNATLLSNQVTHSGSTLGNMDYKLFTGLFTADTNAATLRFQSLNNSFQGIALDGVSVQAIPEPSTAVLIGLGGVALVARRLFGRAV